MNLKTVLGWLAVALIVWWSVSAPASAAHVIHNLGTFLIAGIHGMAHFFTSI